MKSLKMLPSFLKQQLCQTRGRVLEKVNRSPWEGYNLSKVPTRHFLLECAIPIKLQLESTIWWNINFFHRVMRVAFEKMFLFRQSHFVEAIRISCHTGPDLKPTAVNERLFTECGLAVIKMYFFPMVSSLHDGHFISQCSCHKTYQRYWHSDLQPREGV